MSRLDDLITSLCPNGVEFKPLGELGRRNRGTSITAGQMKELDSDGGTVRIFAGGQTVSNVNEGSIPERDVIRVPSIIVRSRGYIGFEFYDEPFSHKSEMWSYSISRSDVDQKFVYYFLLTRIQFLQTLARSTSVKLPQLSVGDTDNLRIPVPPIEVQREIVRILDHFTELEAELEAELAARRRQYEHYRELAFSSLSSECVPLILGDLGNFVRGSGMQKSDLRDQGTPAIHYGQIHTHYGTWAEKSKSFVDPTFGSKLRSASPGDLVIVTTSEDDQAVGKAVAWMGQESAAVSGDAYVYRHSLDPKYLSYFFQTRDFHGQKQRHITGTKVRRISSEALAKIRIPVPTLEVQSRIASSLDSFDMLINDLSVGLPAELAARRKQYEHYRDKLFTFDELPS